VAGARPEDPGPVSTIGRALTILGDQWTLLVLQRAFLGIRRFAGWQQDLGVSTSVLANRLREMTANGLFELHPYRDGRTRYEYRLTDRGLDLWRMLVAMWSWERAWVERPEPLPDLVHDGCAESVDVRVVCAACGEAVDPRATTVTRTEGVAFAQSQPRRLHRRRSREPLPTDPLSWLPGTMEIFGDRWGTSVLAGAFLRIQTFTDFEQELGIGPDVLSDRLRRFVAHGVLRVERSGQAGRRGRYRLTEKGLAFFPVYATMIDWADRWLAGDGHPRALVITHRACGTEFRPELTCTVCDQVLTRRSVHFAL
jgi:DNA-binding HxlR family transcriptional regulator